jgi:hypothetical protein
MARVPRIRRPPGRKRAGWPIALPRGNWPPLQLSLPYAAAAGGHVVCVAPPPWTCRAALGPLLSSTGPGPSGFEAASALDRRRRRRLDPSGCAAVPSTCRRLSPPSAHRRQHRPPLHSACLRRGVGVSEVPYDHHRIQRTHARWLSAAGPPFAWSYPPRRNLCGQSRARAVEGGEQQEQRSAPLYPRQGQVQP